MTPADHSHEPRRQAGRARRLALGGLLLLATGCFELKQTISLEKDGQLEFSLHYAIPEAHLDAFRQFHSRLAVWQDAERGEGMNWIFNRQALEEYFSDDLFTITGYTTYQREGRRHVEVVGRADDGAKALASGKLGNFALVRRPEGGVDLTLQPPRPERVQTFDEADRQALSEAARGFAVTLVVKTPAPVKTTNGRKTAPDEVVWRFGPELLATPGTLPEKLAVGF